MIYERAWGRMLRLAGYLPLWGIVALALVLHDRAPPELLKIVLRREWPGLTDGVHVFRPWSEHPFSSAQLGLPSSEVAVAFAAATALARLFPEGWLLWYGLAVGCASAPTRRRT